MITTLSGVVFLSPKILQGGIIILRKYAFFILAVLAAARFAGPASAEAPLALGAVEVTGSRLAEDVEDVPAPVYVITRDEIERSGARSAQELIARVPGVTGLVNSAAMTQSKGVSVRGLSTEVLLLIDGVPAMNASYGVGAALGSPFDLRSVPPGDIERIEVVKGASSAIYGSNAAGGVINIITRKSAEKSGGAILLEGGSGEWFRGSVRGTAVLSDDSRVTVGYARTREGDRRIRLLPDGTYDMARDYRGNDYLFRAEAGAWSFSAEMGNYRSKWDYYNRFGGRLENNSQKNDYGRILLGYHDGGTTARVYYHINERSIYDAYGVTDYEDRSFGLSLNRKTEVLGLPAIFGLDLRREEAEYENRNNPFGNSNPYDLARGGAAPYVEFTVPLGELGLDVGLRYEYWNVDRGEDVSELIPRVSLNWEDMGGGLWYLTAGRFFSMPSFMQMFYSNVSWSPNPDLKPEKGWSYDLGYKNLKARNPWSLGIFYMTMDDRINHKSDPITWVGQYVNVDKYRAWGVEAEITFNLSESWTYTQGLSWTKADEKNAGSDWTRTDAPRWDISGRLGYSRGPWNGELTLNWLLDRKIKNNRVNYSDKDIFMVDLAVAWERGRDKVRLACVNLFDKEYVLDGEGYITPERRFVISYERTF